MSATTTFKATCPDFVSGLFTSRDQAERWLARVEKIGACHLPHEIVEVVQ